MLHGAGMFTYIRVIFRVNVGKYSSTMVRIWESCNWGQKYHHAMAV